MKQLSLSLLALTVLFACGRPALAIWTSISEETLIQDSELIVQGIVDRTQFGFSLGGRDYDFAVINVSDVLSSLFGFAGLSYPFAPTAMDPCDSTCPNVLP